MCYSTYENAGLPGRNSVAIIQQSGSTQGNGSCALCTSRVLILGTVIENLKWKRQKIQCSVIRAGTWIPLVVQRDMSTLVHPSIKRSPKPVRVTSKNYKRKCKLVPSSSGPALDSQEEKAVESRWVFNHTSPAWPLAVSLSYLCPEGWSQMISKVPSSL